MERRLHLFRPLRFSTLALVMAVFPLVAGAFTGLAFLIYGMLDTGARVGRPDLAENWDFAVTVATIFLVVSSRVCCVPGLTLAVVGMSRKEPVPFTVITLAANALLLTYSVTHTADLIR
jgi:hypothetical protein